MLKRGEIERVAKVKRCEGKNGIRVEERKNRWRERISELDWCRCKGQARQYEPVKQ